MSTNATKDDIKRLEEKIDSSNAVLREEMVAMRKDFDGSMIDMRKDIDGSIDKAVNELSDVIRQLAFSMSEQISEVKADIADLRASIDQLTRTMDKFVGRLDAQELEAAAQNSRFEKLLDWAREVSKKTGIPLKDL